jgi:transketolase
LFEEQSENYQLEVLGTAPVISVEAGSTFGWNRYAQKTIGIDSYGASAPANKLFEYFGLTPQHIADEITDFIK